MGTLQADTLAAAAERAGKKVAQIDWVGGANAGVIGPTVDFVNFFSTRGVLAAPLNADRAGWRGGIWYFLSNSGVLCGGRLDERPCG